MSWWDEARDDKLRALAAKGLGTRALAEALGGGVTKNAVIGRARRLGIKLLDRKGAAGWKAKNGERLTPTAAGARPGIPSRPAVPGAPFSARPSIEPAKVCDAPGPAAKAAGPTNSPERAAEMHRGRDPASSQAMASSGKGTGPKQVERSTAPASLKHGGAGPRETSGVTLPVGEKPAPAACTILAIGPDQCRFPLDRTDADGMALFCGAPKDPASTAPYCRACRRVVYGGGHVGKAEAKDIYAARRAMLLKATAERMREHA